MSRKPSFLWGLLTVLVALWLAVCGAVELRRVEGGSLFLWAIPFDRPASPMELADAAQTAQEYFLPALSAVLMTVVFLSFAVWRWRMGSWHAHRWAMGMLLIAATADLVTTVRFFHLQGVEFELHPGIRLCAYAYGRTVGPLLGKTLQTGGLILISGLFPRHGKALLLGATVAYLIGSVLNLSSG